MLNCGILYFVIFFALVIFFFKFIIFFFKFIIFFFKYNFLIVHYYLLNTKNFNSSEKYANIVYFFVTWPNRLILYFLYHNINFFQLYRMYFYIFFKYFFHFVIVAIFFYDIYFNNYYLTFFCSVLPWYSFYQFFYKINSFLYYNLEYLFDVIITEALYSNDEFKLYCDSIETVEYLIIRDYIKFKLLL